MVGLYKILMLDTDGDSGRLKALKYLIYNMVYMDNGAITTDTSDNLVWSFNQLNSIFNLFQFHLQQFCTNDEKLQNVIGTLTDPIVDLFGLS